MEFKFSSSTASANRKEHGVSVSHAEQSLRDTYALTIKDPDTTEEPRYVSLGMGALGRILVVVHTRHTGRIQLISAREASPDEIRQYHA